MKPPYHWKKKKTKMMNLKIQAKIMQTITHTETKSVLKVSVTEVLLSYFWCATLNFT